MAAAGDGELLLLLLLAAFASKRAARAPSSAPPAEDEAAPDYNMSPEDQAEALPISSDGSVTLQRGKAYRLSADLESASPIDARELKRLMIVAGARDVSIGERPPHRATWNMTAPVDFTVRIGAPLPFQLGGVTVRLRSARPIAGSPVVVGRRRSWR